MKIEFTPYMHIERLGTDEVEGILNGHVVVTTKLDGSGFVTWLSDGELKVGSSKRVITPEDDNQGCAKWVYAQDNYKAYLEKHSNHILYGEYLIKNHIKDYDITAYKKGYIFDIFDVETKKWLPYEEYTKMLDEFNITYIPAIAILDNPSEQDIYNLLDKTTYLHGGKVGEGCFGSSARVLMADMSYKKIVDVKVGDYVKSYNCNTNTVEDKKVLNVFYNGKKPYNEWYSMVVESPQTHTGRHAFMITKNHMVFDGVSFSEVKNQNYVYVYEKYIGDFRKQAVLGIVCSDGCFSKGLISVAQVESKYLDWYDMLKPIVGNARFNVSGKGSKIAQYWIHGAYTQQLIGEFILDRNNLDYVKIFNELDDVGWAYMFMGDGSCYKRQIEICLSSYTEEEVNKIKDIFDKRFGVLSTIHSDKRVRNGSGACLRLHVCDGYKFINRIGAYILPSYRYKIESFNMNIEYKFPQKYEEEYRLIRKPIYRKTSGDNLYKSKQYTGEKAYDLEIQDNHNYIVEGVLVHNCVLHAPDFKNKYGCTVWAKVLTGEYLKQKHTKLGKIPNQLEHDIVDKYITEDFVEKEYCKLVNDMGGWQSKYIGRLLGTIWHTFIEEETWNIIKKFHNPVIDFSVLNKLVVQRIKEIKKI